MPCKRFHGKICHHAKVDDYAKIAGFKGVDGNLSAEIGDVSDNITLFRWPTVICLATWIRISGLSHQK